ncbi:dTDP-4-dehydrorhamnose 3,5-epimerase family protein [Aliiroseovarius sp. KMU-50]|uniref:dTDP-4-dehydrorhamnose 3,5-epimerase n=1 Tax=Aliiroseovarius salicola TaxID=3009082 RepID=A0ABT4W5D5_9RHOB|nr:dTDP-4-dehydrorhamnose 3,5-epimerase family protein [Aliiroseovarius sp. KMU-50]MDA5095739.1 dTDP-4-dehydrorhamnose 3,5-epimerase family protein [Aliiroseovarius sp. KMU-50]
MQFVATPITGAVEIRPTPNQDSRGFFARSYCAREFAENGLSLPDKQMAISHNLTRATLRGMHYIPETQGEAKLVRCIHGHVFDVIVDMRPNSPSFMMWYGIELSAENLLSLYIPRGVAHGFITLSDNADLFYQFDAFHKPGVETGLRWDDPDIAICWPIAPQTISERDLALPFLRDMDVK